ncbi:MAG: hypothetical protein GAK43_00878 [Stenotrophomonas maltophilia]|nr:MAG: hypothetical protein GAK43_00878 [Stenotrophomonas maltophilia]
MAYLIETFDEPGHAQVRARERAEHLAFLERHSALLLACGAKLNDDGSDAGGGIYIVDVDSREAAERFIADDPFSHAGLFERVSIVRWRKAYLDGQCHLPR